LNPAKASGSSFLDPRVIIELLESTLVLAESFFTLRSSTVSESKFTSDIFLAPIDPFPLAATPLFLLPKKNQKPPSQIEKSAKSASKREK
jgi:hypothetical protein